MACKISYHGLLCLCLLGVFKPICAQTCGEDLSASTNSQSIVATARGVKCVWKITAPTPGKYVKIEFVANSMVGQMVAESNLAGAAKKCVGDVVRVYDGKSLELSGVNKWHDANWLQVFYSTNIGSSESGYFLGEICGKGTLSQFKSVEPAITVVFVSRTTDANRGFTINYMETDDPVKVSRLIMAKRNPTILSSPRYPSGQVKNMDITWTFKPLFPTHDIRLTFTEVNLGDPADCANNYIRVYIGNSSSTLKSTVCGTETGVYQSTNNILTVVMKTENNMAKRGFKATYNTFSGLDMFACAKFGDVLDAKSQEPLVTPNYPNTYPNLADCKYIVKANSFSIGSIRLTILDAEFAGPTSCTKDYITIYDGDNTNAPILGRVCGKTSKVFESTKDAMLIRFISDSNVGAKGAKMTFKAITSGSSGQCSWASVLLVLTAALLAI